MTDKTDGITIELTLTDGDTRQYREAWRAGERPALAHLHRWASERQPRVDHATVTATCTTPNGREKLRLSARATVRFGQRKWVWSGPVGRHGRTRHEETIGKCVADELAVAIGHWGERQRGASPLTVGRIRRALQEARTTAELLANDHRFTTERFAAQAATLATLDADLAAASATRDGGIRLAREEPRIDTARK